MNIFENTKYTAIAEEKVVNTSIFAIPETGVYKAKLVVAYLSPKAPANRTDIIFVFELGSGYTWTLPVYAVMKDGKATTTDEDGKQKTLFGFTQAQRIMFAFTGKTLNELGSNIKDRIIEVYNFDTRKNEPTTVQAFVDTIGTEGYVGLQRKIENKKVLEDGAYVKVAERKQVAVLAIVANLNGQTMTEVQSNTPPVALNSWEDLNAGKDWDAYEAVKVAGFKPETTFGSSSISFDPQ